MSGQQVRHVRERLRLTQQQAARRWKVSQTYLSLMENGHRPVPGRLVQQLARRVPELATVLPLPRAQAELKDLPQALGSLGYPGFEYLARPTAVANPAAVVLAALKKPESGARVTEALPWVLVRFPNLDWQWLVAEAKLANLQNKLGYLVSLARQVAAAQGVKSSDSALEAASLQLEEARLAREDPLGRAGTNAEREYFRRHRPEAAAHWNLLTTLRAEDLRYA